MLDLVGTECNPLGYNHKAFLKNLNNKEYDAYLINNVTTNEIANDKFLKLVKSVMIPIAPKGLSAVTFTH